MDNKHYLSRFGSITWSERESHYSQAKIEIYSLWQALQDYQLYIIGVKNLRVEIDVSYIKGMLNNPDIQPVGTVNRWIIGIKLFQFELVHVPGCLHMGPDGLSHWAASPNDPAQEDDPDWLDKTMSFTIILMNSQPSWSEKLNSHYRLTCSLSHWPKTHPMYSVYFDDEVAEEVFPMDIPCSELAQCTDDQLDSIRAILLNPLTPTDLSESAVCNAVHYASKFLMDSRLMLRDLLVILSNRDPIPSDTANHPWVARVDEYYARNPQLLPQESSPPHSGEICGQFAPNSWQRTPKGRKCKPVHQSGTHQQRR